MAHVVAHFASSLGSGSCRTIWRKSEVLKRDYKSTTLLVRRAQLPRTLSGDLTVDDTAARPVKPAIRTWLWVHLSSVRRSIHGRRTKMRRGMGRRLAAEDASRSPWPGRQPHAHPTSPSAVSPIPVTLIVAHPFPRCLTPTLLRQTSTGRQRGSWATVELCPWLRYCMYTSLVEFLAATALECGEGATPQGSNCRLAQHASGVLRRGLGSSLMTSMVGAFQRFLEDVVRCVPAVSCRPRPLSYPRVLQTQ
jgi:hypothetical protein